MHCRRKSKTHSYFMGHQLIFFVKISNTLGAVTLTWRASSDHSHLQKITSHRLLMKQRAHLLQSLTFCWRFNITFQNNARFKSCTSYFFPIQKSNINRSYQFNIMKLRYKNTSLWGPDKVVCCQWLFSPPVKIPRHPFVLHHD